MNGWRKKGGSQGGKQVGRESEENEGGWEEGTQELIKSGRKEAMEVDQMQEVMVVHMYMGFVKCHTYKKSGTLKSHLWVWHVLF